jgi:hypothetical protein
MVTGILAALVALVPLVLAILEAFQKHQVAAAAPEKRDEKIDQAFAGSDEAVGAELHALRDRMRRNGGVE